MPSREPLSGPDNAWRRMGKRTNLMSITGVLILEGRVSYEQLCDRLESRLLRFERFRQHIGGQTRHLRRPYWETGERFDIHNHVYHLALPEPADTAALERFVGTLMSRPLDESRPLWEIYLVDNAGPDGGDAAVVRINHTVGDGFALLSVMLGLVDNPGELSFPIDGVSAPPPPAAETGDRPDGQPGSQLGERVGGSGLLGTVRTAARAVRAGYRLLTMPDEPETSLSGELGPTKRVAWTRRFELADVKQIGDAHDATVNDVLLAVTAGAVRRVLEAREEDTTDLELRWTIPVNLKPMAERTESLGNYFGVAFVPVPVGARDFGERIDIVNERMDVQTTGVEAFLMYKLLTVAGHIPAPAQEFAVGLFERAATGVVTNVPGPVRAAKLAGAEISDMIFWVPQAIDQGLGISIISYNEGIRIGVAADANLLPDPHLLADAFESELASLFNTHGV